MGMTKIYTEKELKERQLENVKKWQKTPYGRANHLLNSYRQSDRKANRGECTLTTEWIVENIFSKPCVHCGKVGWDIIGCNRVDDTKPHTKDNVEPCCFECNRKCNYKHRKQQTIQRKKGFRKLYEFIIKLSKYKIRIQLYKTRWGLDGNFMFMKIDYYG